MDPAMKTPARAPKLQRQAAATAEGPLSPRRAFVVQFREPSAVTSPHFAGRVEHMISGDAVRFQSPEELLAFFGRVLGAAQTNRSKE